MGDRKEPTTPPPDAVKPPPPPPPPDKRGCDHKFIDSRACVKCGWTPHESPPSQPDGHRGPWRRARALRSPFESRVVLVGDRIRFDTALLEQIHALPDHRAELVTVERIVREVDGTLTLTLRRSSSSDV